MPPHHRYTVGQRIEFMPGRYDGSAPSGAYTVVRQLPNDAQDREYRVKNSRDGHERIIRESQMRQGVLG
ncbi:hypothetical protein [Falsiroseomonas sp. E2-1-a4]|uniref:hypothetical protein n=1 Tax=Falsiroseomonas sp. E2-1-a4 TaxID=3239299 RepID=UPI003F38AA40